MADADATLKPPAPADAAAATPVPAPAPPAQPTVLGSATYEIIRQRLSAHGAALRTRMAQLDQRRQAVFGAVEYKLLQADRILTAHSCLPIDMVQLGHNRFLFGFNVQFGMRKEIDLGHVFAVYRRDEATGNFKDADLGVLQDQAFRTDFKRLYNVYERAAFNKFSLIDGHLYMVFSVGTGVNDIAAFKWAFNDGQLRYVDGRSETEYRRVGYPPAHEFRWQVPDRESFRYGDYPHISIEDRVFLECVGGDLTIKVEDNTSSGEGIYAEPVEDRHQKVDDAEIAYASVGGLIVLKVRPYKESEARYFIFNEKQQSVVRVDSIGQSCALLPEEHGLIFPDGYYLVTGELKRFESRDAQMVLERVVNAPNGEDTLFVFYNRLAGAYALMPYRLILQKVEERISCNGFSLFPNGQLLLFRADDEPQKHHLIQLRQTPFHQAGYEPPGQRDAFLYQVGNKEVVRCLAECNEVLTLLGKETPYAELYADLVKQCGAMLDAYPWLSHADGFNVAEALRQVGDVADQAVAEFDKVRRLQREAVQRLRELRTRCDACLQTLRRTSFRVLDDYVRNLALLRQLRGELITLKELRYVDVAKVTETESAVAAQTAELAKACVKFLLDPASLEPYRQQAQSHLAAAGRVGKVADARQLERAAVAAGAELEMLIEIVNSLRIEDTTEATRIIDGISAVYAILNQVKAALKNRLQELVVAEGAAQFAAQMKLLGQAAASYLDLCETPAKCDEYLNRLSVQLEELEGQFADFAEYTVQLTDKRTALYEAFEQRKLALVEQRNRKTAALQAAAERVLKAIQNRLGSLKTVDDINAYMASDLMSAKVRDVISQLLELGDSVKADDLQGRLKSAHQEAVRQLKDRQELFAGGPGLIQLGRHRFNINTQALELTLVNRDGVQHLHLTSTRYFAPVTDPAFLATRDAWEQEVVSENAEVYRAEYLAARLLRDTESREGGVAAALALSEGQRLAAVQEFMGPRYQDGYIKGVHDLDAARIYAALLATQEALQLARYRPAARACALVYWFRFCPAETRALWTAKLKGFGVRNRLFPGDAAQPAYTAALQALLREWAAASGLFPQFLAAEAGRYLFEELIGGDTVVVSREADELATAFRQRLVVKGCEAAFQEARAALAGHPGSELELVRDWVRGFLRGENGGRQHYLEEVVALLFCGEGLPRRVIKAGAVQTLADMKGAHRVIRSGSYVFDHHAFHERLARFDSEVVPSFERYQQLKQQLLEGERAKLRLDEFRPRVLTSFVRNQLIDRVYLPLVGDNLAKQIGAAGAAKRTDLMGMLLLISPPGYGKTTLMEYVASRLGILFVKINGPAIGHTVTSLDPQEAANAAAREEVHKLNLAFEMGDNVMLCLDDIQHCNPEFLQKFISLCDGQRKIEGVWRGQPRTYDLRGRKLVVVMAGNPYTESGQKFKIPDMLANRADTYNLGDIIGGNAEWFEASYLENAVTSNAVLAPLANRSQKDIHAFIRMAAGGSRETDGFEGSYSAQEVDDILAVMTRLVRLRQVVLRVNQEYIHSAGQADEFRTEPPFRLQGSYRNMNRLAEKVVSLMNDADIEALLLDHYRNEAQTLTTGAEANLLKFKELLGVLTVAEKERWDEIRKTFRRQQLLRGSDQSDAVGRVVGQLSAFQAGLQGIQDTLEKQLARPAPPLTVDLGPLGQRLEALRTALAEGLTAAARASQPPPAVDLAPLAQRLDALRTTLDDGFAAAARGRAAPEAVEQLAAQVRDGLAALGAELGHAVAVVQADATVDQVRRLGLELELMYGTLAHLQEIAAQQRDYLRATQEQLAERARQGTIEIELTQDMMRNEQAFLDRFHQALADTQRPPPAAAQ